MNWVEPRGVTELDLTSFFSLGGSIIGISGLAYPTLWERSNRPCSARRFRRAGYRYFFFSFSDLFWAISLSFPNCYLQRPEAGEEGFIKHHSTLTNS